MGRAVYFIMLSLSIIYYGYKSRKEKKKYREEKYKKFKCKHRFRIIEMIGGYDNDCDND